MAMVIYTIGFTQKSAETFFEILRGNKIDALIDIRLNNKSQLAGFAKGRDLQFFLRELCAIQYYYAPEFAPSAELLDDWKKGRITWEEYETVYKRLMADRKAETLFVNKYLKETEERICLLCSESTPEHCHRRLLAEYLVERISDLKEALIIHL